MRRLMADVLLGTLVAIVIAVGVLSVIGITFYVRDLYSYTK